MTDDEKKEYEEFLKWKKEKLQREMNNVKEQTKKEEKAGPERFVPDGSKHIQTVEEQNGKYAKWAILAIGAIFLAFLVKGFVDSYKSPRERRIEALRHDSLVAADKARQDSIIKEQRVAKAKQDSIARIKRQETLKHTIRIKSAYLSSPNSASGVSAYFYYVNTSTKDIKYLTWHGYPINAVGDVVFCDIRDYSNYSGRDTGPVKPGRSSGGCWDCAWYNWQAKKLVLTGVDIEYMDGTTFSISKDELKYVR